MWLDVTLAISSKPGSAEFGLSNSAGFRVRVFKTVGPCGGDRLSQPVTIWAKGAVPTLGPFQNQRICLVHTIDTRWKACSSDLAPEEPQTLEDQTLRYSLLPSGR